MPHSSGSNLSARISDELTFLKAASSNLPSTISLSFCPWHPAIINCSQILPSGN
ncbi:hypothetical protein BT96DRAFT_869588 [Gymnopus androsaceus JB14]|uniref:Uncharacterized protein n=1 Tax=Gymnopus androsaceus JB14 TaxID=1447944 RepID=A0A6A4GBE6_9AGAR|nr:hypothetical protein BT96DRAFT_869588 [Gymnopus androsaceus JB14]